MMSIAASLLILSMQFTDAPAAPTPVASDSQASIEFFEKRIRPILLQRCSECHSKVKEQRGGLVFDHRPAIIEGGDSGPAATPGFPEKSLLIRAVRYTDELIQMPPNGKLPDHEIEALTEWVRIGLPFPSKSTAADRKGVIDIAAGRNHWAFRPFERRVLPVTPEDPMLATRLDAFITDARREHHLLPSPRADSATLIRRAKFNLCGLPPSFEEARSFVADNSPDAYDRLLDRYLAAPQYGERWGRNWLDLARYCDEPERWREGVGQPWLYRDWVVSAFNRDLPYDTFVRLQLAADLVPGTDLKDFAALGFLGLSPTYWKELKLDHRVIMQVVAEEWEERIEAISATYLGLTVACARCHDHKFDPITTRDYYGLAGVLASIKLEDRPLLPKDAATSVDLARTKVRQLQKKLDELKKSKEPCENQAAQISKVQTELEETKKVPEFDTPYACLVTEASIVVGPDGPHRTRIDYRPGEAQDVALHIRGNAANLGDHVPRRFLSVLRRHDEDRFVNGSGRLELADSIVGDAAALASRVYVNRIWFHHFGRGLVTTMSNFGTQAEMPSHPELLEDLASQFVADGWSTKRLHRELLLSETFRQSSRRDAEKFVRDPDNVWLWRMPPRRLEVEAWRDATLVAADELDFSIGRAPVDINAVGFRRRTIYGTVRRRELDDLFRLHDFPDPVAHSAHREPTITPLQQLYVFNSPFIFQRSQALVQRVRSALAAVPQPSNLPQPVDDTDSVSKQIELFYQFALGRPPKHEEARHLREFVLAANSSGEDSNEMWRQIAQVLLGSNEFLFVD